MRFFTESKSLQSLERMMQEVPGFHWREDEEPDEEETEEDGEDVSNR